ncbi:MAG: LamB/YcsF family protein [Cereibacter sphaeroides]|uniref:LamB/YcsF family protein n=1 Tax=Cereibacter sphaeroides TaxID=1063 RepID=A0A2W5SCK1_CERSP|nr:MAG: LamB/YcsF family protein [Cereibacter sphaeroides]
MGGRIDLNADLGEGIGDDAAMLTIVSSANIACGAHAGGPDLLLATLTTAKANGVAAGAHPGYADRANFGRNVVPMSAAELEYLVAWQIGAALGVAALAGHRIAYVKIHGALYNLAAVDADVATAIARGVTGVDPNLTLLCPALSQAERAGEAAGLRTAAEVFADRAYRPDGTLMPRSEPGAVIHDPDQVVARTLDMLDSGRIRTSDNGLLPLRMDSICLHGDTSGAVQIARRLRSALEGAGWRIAPFAQ